MKALGIIAALGFWRLFAQQPLEPIDITPIDGETYYILNQLSALEVDLSDGRVVQQSRSFSSLSQRWAFTRLSSGFWQIGNVLSELCLDGDEVRAPGRGHAIAKATRGTVVQNSCAAADSQQWTLTATSNGYYTIANKSSGLMLDSAERSGAAGELLEQTALTGVASQGQQWLLRPAFFRGMDNALLEKQEAARIAAGLPWWNDAGQQQDVLATLKNHGVNMVRLRPSSAPPYVNPSQAQCSGNACYAETDAQDLDLAKRAKNLGLSVELTLLFDGGASASVPPAWAGDTELSALQADLYAYVKAEILSYRQNGTMPDLVAIGNEVDTGFLGALGSPTGADFAGFAALQTAGLQAVRDAAADTSVGPAIPAPLTCIHITPAWDLSQFFTLANEFNISYDAICQSYYPLFHGPLTSAQAAAANPGGKPIEQEVLINAANNITKPIFIIETGEHFENGFDANDPWYAPPTPALQRQFLLDLESAQKSLPNNLGMGMEYWDPSGVNISNASGRLANGDNLPNAIYVWNGLTLFDDASMLLPGIDALGGKLDATLNYKFVNLGNGQILSVYQGSSAAGAMLETEADSGNPSFSQQWRIGSNDDGYFQIASLNSANVLTGSGSAITQSPAGSGQGLEWNIVSAGNGSFHLVNRASGLVLDLSGGFAIAAQESGSTTEEWQIVAVH
jgi:arabinogalactan endo-1,4-beta-galactosidase